MRTEVTTSPFVASLRVRWDQDLHLCVGLDPRLDRLPPPFSGIASRAEAIASFVMAMVDATHDLVCAYKPNAAYYEALGEDGLRALIAIVGYIKRTYPEIPVLLDAKRGDIGETMAAYGEAVFGVIGADAVTVHPYFGQQALLPILERADKGVIVMGANSNPGAGEFQDLPVGADGDPLYLHVSRQVAHEWNRHGNCGVTVGATEPAKIARVRAAVGDLPLLVLGIGVQGGDIDATVRAGKDSRGQGMIISTSRAVMYASDGLDAQDAARRAAVDLTVAIRQALVTSSQVS